MGIPYKGIPIVIFAIRAHDADSRRRVRHRCQTDSLARKLRTCGHAFANDHPRISLRKTSFGETEVSHIH